MIGPQAPEDGQPGDALWVQLGSLSTERAAEALSGVRFDRQQPPGDELLRLCQGDTALFDRLVHYERHRFPHLGWAALVRRAINHYQSDNR